MRTSVAVLRTNRQLRGPRLDNPSPCAHTDRPHEENAMDHRVERLRTPAECEIFARNAVAKNRPDLALEAQRKAVNLKVATHEAVTPLEAEALATVYAHEALLAHRNGRKTRATGTWQAIKRHGIIAAITKVVSRRAQTDNRVA